MNTIAWVAGTRQKFRENLIQLSEQSDIAWAVATEALKYEKPEDFFEDLFRMGCISGMIGRLCWYSDTHAFYDEHYDEIEELREDLEECIGEPLRIRGDLKNFFAWFAFEEVAYRIAAEWELL